MDNKNYIYIIRRREHVRLDEPIYKIGHTTRGIERLKEYDGGLGIEIHAMLPVVDSSEAEKRLIRVFDGKYESALKSTGSKESYRGDIDEMIKDIRKVAKGYDTPKDVVKEENSIPKLPPRLVLGPPLPPQQSSIPKMFPPLVALPKQELLHEHNYISNSVKPPKQILSKTYEKYNQELIINNSNIDTIKSFKSPYKYAFKIIIDNIEQYRRSITSRVRDSKYIERDIRKVIYKYDTTINTDIDFAELDKINAPIVVEHGDVKDKYYRTKAPEDIRDMIRDISSVMEENIMPMDMRITLISNNATHIPTAQFIYKIPLTIHVDELEIGRDEVHVSKLDSYTKPELMDIVEYLKGHISSRKLKQELINYIEDIWPSKYVMYDNIYIDNMEYRFNTLETYNNMQLMKIINRLGLICSPYDEKNELIDIIYEGWMPNIIKDITTCSNYILYNMKYLSANLK